MPLDLDSRSVSRLNDRALHRQLADLLRQRIADGRLRPGEALPSETELGSTLGVNRATVRDGLEILAQEGLIVKRPGMATRVATPAPVRHMDASRYADELAILRALAEGEQHPWTSAFTHDHDIAWDAYRVECSYSEDTATAQDATRLHLPEGAAVLRRQMIKYVSDQPVQLQDSVMPLPLVAGTPLTDPGRQPWPGGTLAELWSIGKVVTRVGEEIRARTPSTAERRMLEMEAAGPVWDIVRVFHVGDIPVEVSTVVCPAASIVLRYETELD
jgi:GntR family transcriptional regulator